MRPRLIAEALLPDMRAITYLGGVGWLVTQPAARAVSILDDELRILARVPIPTEDQLLGASADDQRVAVVTNNDLIVVDRQGQLLWRMPWSLFRQRDQRAERRTSSTPRCHLDTHGVLWVHLPPKDELVAVEAATGREIDRVDLDTTHGGAYFVRYPGGAWTGLHVAMGQDGSLSWLTQLESGRIVLRPLAGECLTGFTSTGAQYFAMPHNEGIITIRDVATDAVVAACRTEDLARDEDQLERLILLEAAAIVSDELVVIAINTDNFDTDLEEHLLLNARTMRPRSTVEYAYPMSHNSIYPAGGRDRWLTCNHQDHTVRLWEIDGPLHDEAISGQEQLF